MKTVILFGSPRKNGNTIQLAQTMTDALKKKLKLVIDRSMAFMDSDYNSRIAGKKAVTLMTFADNNMDTCKPTLDMFKKSFDLLKLSYAGNIEVPGCIEGGTIKEEYMKKIRKLVDSLA